MFRSFVRALFGPRGLRTYRHPARRDPRRLGFLQLEDRTVPSASLLTDKDDYGFGEVAAITGSGFVAGEEVTLRVTHAPGSEGSNADAQNQPWVITADSEGNVSASWTVDDPDAVGASYVLTATGSAGSSASTTFTDGALTGVSVDPQTGTATYGTGSSVTFGVDVTGSGGAPRNWSLSVSGLPTGVSGSFSPVSGTSFGGPNDSTLTLTTTGAGASRTLPGTYSFTVTATATGGTTGGPFTSTGTLTVSKKTLTVTGITANSRAYDGTTTATLNTTGASISGVVVGDSVTLVTGGTTGAFNNKNVGAAKPVTVTGLALGGSEASRYTFTQPAGVTANVTPKALVGSFTVADRVYDGTTAATITSRSLSGVIPGDTVNYTGGAATFDTKNVGDDKAVTAAGFGLGGADKDNYTVNSTAATTADVTPRTIVGRIAAANKVYDGTTAATITDRVLGGLLGADDVSYVGGTATFDDKNVGSGKLVTATGLSIVGADAGNYTVNPTAATFADVTARDLAVSAAGVNKVYDGTADATVTLSSDALPGDDVTLAYATAAFADKHVGTGKAVSVSGISVGGTDAGNYNLLSETAATAASITARAITVTATADTKVYDGNTSSAAVPTITAGDLVGGDSAELTQTFDSKNAGARTLSPAAAISDGNGGNNYDVTYVAAAGSITRLAITGSITAANKVYDGTTAATITGRTLGGAVPGDDVSYVGGTATFASPNAGTWAVTATGLTLSGADAGNYTVNGTATTTATITPKSLGADATTQAALNASKQGVIAFAIKVNAGDVVDGQTVAALFTGVTFTIRVGTQEFAATSVATVVGDTVHVSIRMGDALQAALHAAANGATSASNASQYGIVVTAASNGGNYTLSDDAVTRLFWAGK